MHYPPDQHIYYEDLKLEQNKNTSQTIRLMIGGNFIFQPFTQLWGGLIKGSIERRHIQNLTMIQGGAYCLDAAAEVIISDGSDLTIRGSKINFYAENALVKISKAAT